MAEDHQTKNARALSDAGAALLVRDADAASTLLPEMIRLLNDSSLQQALKTKLKPFAKPAALTEIVNALESIS